MNVPTPHETFWHAHGTKLLGYAVSVIGVAGESLALIQAFDPKRSALWALIIGVGGAVVRRGYSNTEKIQQTLIAKGWTPPPGSGS